MPAPTDPVSARGADADSRSTQALPQQTEILILPDARVLVHNLTPVMAAILEPLNPGADEIRDRVAVARAQAKPGQEGDRYL
mgnify:CR=1 FL=1